MILLKTAKSGWKRWIIFKKNTVLKVCVKCYMRCKITPWRAVYRTTQLLGTPKENIKFILASSGHIQSLINPPGNPKSRFFTNHALPATTDAWIAGGVETKGSWWDTWADWLIERSGKTKKSPKSLGSAAFAPLAAAPGDYVHG